VTDDDSVVEPDAGITFVPICEMAGGAVPEALDEEAVELLV
jgi:hypothetical protein